MPLRGLITPSERLSLSLRFSPEPIEPVVFGSPGRIFSGIVVSGSGRFGSRGCTGVCARARLTIRSPAPPMAHARTLVLATEAMTSSLQRGELRVDKEVANASQALASRWLVCCAVQRGPARPACLIPTGLMLARVVEHRRPVPGLTLDRHRRQAYPFSIEVSKLPNRSTRLPSERSIREAMRTLPSRVT